jgi:valyl-tRNA synthetase
MNGSAKYTLLTLLKEQLRALHPFMPFVTEEIWSLIHNENPEKLLIIEEDGQVLNLNGFDWSVSMLIETE